MKNNKVLFLTQAAMIAAIYVVITLIFAPIGSGEVQLRVSEALTILPYFTPAAIPGLFIGCLIANFSAGLILLDVLCGSAATLIGACVTCALRKNSPFLAPLGPIVANMLIVPFVLKYGYGSPLPIPFMMGTVGLGEVLSCGVLGMVLLFALKKYRVVIFKNQTA